MWLLRIEEPHITWPDRNGDTQPWKDKISHNVLSESITNLHMDGCTTVGEIFAGMLIKVDINARCEGSINSGGIKSRFAIDGESLTLDKVNCLANESNLFTVNEHIEQMLNGTKILDDALFMSDISLHKCIMHTPNTRSGTTCLCANTCVPMLLVTNDMCGSSTFVGTTDIIRNSIESSTQ